MRENTTATLRIFFRDEMLETDKKSLLYGWIVNESGKPIPKMRVFCQSMDSTSYYLRASNSDDAGVYYFPGVQPGGQYLLVLVPEGEKDAIRTLVGCEVPRDGKETRMDLVLGTRQVTVRVRSSSGPVIGADVSLREENASGRLVSVRKTDDLGGAVFSRLPEGKYLLEVVSSGHARTTVRSVQVTGVGMRTDPVDVLLIPESSIELCFVGKDLLPRTDWTALILDAGGEPVFQFSRLCDENGKLTIVGLAAGTYRVFPIGRSGKQLPENKCDLGIGEKAKLQVLVD